MDKISIKRSIKLEVNDDGEYIEFYPEDNNFQLKILEIMELMNEPPQEIREILEKESSGSLAEVKEKMLAKKTYIDAVTVRIDEAFGDNCCKKVFGDIVPELSLISEFVAQISPYVEKYIDERKSRIEKYSGTRKGARSKK